MKGKPEYAIASELLERWGNDVDGLDCLVSRQERIVRHLQALEIEVLKCGWQDLDPGSYVNRMSIAWDFKCGCQSSHVVSQI